MKKILVFLLASSILVGCSSHEGKEVEKKQPLTVTYTYEIQTVSTDGYYGKASDGTGIFFTNDDLKTPEDIREGDTVKAVFDRDDTVDGIIDIYEDYATR